MNKWSKENSVVPDDDDTPFVVHSESGFTQTYSPIPEFDEDDDGALFDFQVTATQDEPFKSFPIYFRFVVTTKRLLANVLKTKHICYKLIWLGFPVLIVGTTDKAKRFHPFGIGVTSSETSTDFAFIFHAISKGVVILTGTKYKPEVLIADAAAAITNGFCQAFGYDQLASVLEFVRIMCWAHVNINCDKKVKAVNDCNLRKFLMQDICNLQLADDYDMFMKGFELFKVKWTNVKNTTVDNFIKYFEDQWVKQNFNWFEGAYDGVPSHDNGLESNNRYIKDFHTFRLRLSLSQFLVCLMDLVKNWSPSRMGTFCKFY